MCILKLFVVVYHFFCETLSMFVFQFFRKVAPPGTTVEYKIRVSNFNGYRVVQQIIKHSKLFHFLPQKHIFFEYYCYEFFEFLNNSFQLQK